MTLALWRTAPGLTLSVSTVTITATEESGGGGGGGGGIHSSITLLVGVPRTTFCSSFLHVLLTAFSLSHPVLEYSLALCHLWSER